MSWTALDLQRGSKGKKIAQMPTKIAQGNVEYHSFGRVYTTFNDYLPDDLVIAPLSFPT